MEALASEPHMKKPQDWEGNPDQDWEGNPQWNAEWERVADALMPLGERFIRNRFNTNFTNRYGQDAIMHGMEAIAKRLSGDGFENGCQGMAPFFLTCVRNEALRLLGRYGALDEDYDNG